jgi:hypothetical protein
MFIIGFTAIGTELPAARDAILDIPTTQANIGGRLTSPSGIALSNCASHKGSAVTKKYLFKRNVRGKCARLVKWSDRVVATFPVDGRWAQVRFYDDGRYSAAIADTPKQVMARGSAEVAQSNPWTGKRSDEST